jgi:hypothetical protein
MRPRALKERSVRAYVARRAPPIMAETAMHDEAGVIFAARPGA